MLVGKNYSTYSFGTRKPLPIKVEKLDDNFLKPPRIVNNFNIQQDILLRIHNNASKKTTIARKGGTELP